MNVGNLIDFFDAHAPSTLAEDWDNVGLLVGDRTTPIQRVMTCLTITPSTVREAIDRKAGVIVAHHPMPFRPLSRITTDTTTGRLLLELIASGVAVYSAHTAFDSARRGINAQLARLLDLGDVRPLLPAPNQPDDLGTGRMGLLPRTMTLADLAGRLKERLHLATCRGVGASEQRVRKVALACGSGGSLLAAAISEQCDTFVTGELSFHSCLEAEAQSIGLLLVGHYASERFAMETLANDIASAHPNLDVWASQSERDPVVAW